MRNRLRLSVVATGLVLGAAALAGCGSDDGSDVREIGGTTGSATTSGSSSGTGASGTGTSTGAETEGATTAP